MNEFDKAKQLFLDGLQLLESEQFELAEAKLSEAHRLLPDRLSVLVNLSAVQIKLQRFEQAKATAQRALALDASHADSWLNLGIAEKGISSYTQALQTMRPSNAT